MCHENTYKLTSTVFKGKLSSDAEHLKNESKTDAMKANTELALKSSTDNEIMSPKTGKASDVGSVRVVVTVTNLGGANGAKLNGEELEPYKAKVMQLGDKLQFGCSHLVFVLEQVDNKWKDTAATSSQPHHQSELIKRIENKKNIITNKYPSEDATGAVDESSREQ